MVNALKKTLLPELKKIGYFSKKQPCLFFNENLINLFE